VSTIAVNYCSPSVADANKASVLPAARAAVRRSGLVIFVRADFRGQPWWCQSHVAKIDGGKLTTTVVFGDEFNPSGTKFRIGGIVARTREEALEFEEGSAEFAIPDGFPQSDLVVVTHQ
jgi:hypothetical protein